MNELKDTPVSGGPDRVARGLESVIIGVLIAGIVGLVVLYREVGEVKTELRGVSRAVDRVVRLLDKLPEPIQEASYGTRK